MENIDKTIDVICNWIQEEVESKEMDARYPVTEMIIVVNSFAILRVTSVLSLTKANSPFLCTRRLREPVHKLYKQRFLVETERN